MEPANNGTQQNYQEKTRNRKCMNQIYLSLALMIQSEIKKCFILYVNKFQTTTGSHIIVFIPFSKCGSWANLDKKTTFHLDFMISIQGLLFFSVVLSPLITKAWAINQTISYLCCTQKVELIRNKRAYLTWILFRFYISSSGASVY